MCYYPLSQYGETEVLQMKIDLISGSVPYKFRVRPLKAAQKENLMQRSYDWLEQRVIKLCTSLLASPLVPVRKKDGGTRWVTDLRELSRP